MRRRNSKEGLLKRKKKEASPGLGQQPAKRVSSADLRKKAGTGTEFFKVQTRVRDRATIEDIEKEMRRQRDSSLGFL